MLRLFTRCFDNRRRAGDGKDGFIVGKSRRHGGRGLQVGRRGASKTDFTCGIRRVPLLCPRRWSHPAVLGNRFSGKQDRLITRERTKLLRPACLRRTRCCNRWGTLDRPGRPRLSATVSSLTASIATSTTTAAPSPPTSPLTI